MSRYFSTASKRFFKKKFLINVSPQIMFSFVIKDYVTPLKLFTVVRCFGGEGTNGLKLEKIRQKF